MFGGARVGLSGGRGAAVHARGIAGRSADAGPEEPAGAVDGALGRGIRRVHVADNQPVPRVLTSPTLPPPPPPCHAVPAAPHPAHRRQHQRLLEALLPREMIDNLRHDDAMRLGPRMLEAGECAPSVCYWETNGWA